MRGSCVARHLWSGLILVPKQTSISCLWPLRSWCDQMKNNLSVCLYLYVCCALEEMLWLLHRPNWREFEMNFVFLSVHLNLNFDRSKKLGQSLGPRSPWPVTDSRPHWLIVLKKHTTPHNLYSSRLFLRYLGKVSLPACRHASCSLTAPHLDAEGAPIQI